MPTTLPKLRFGMRILALVPLILAARVVAATPSPAKTATVEVKPLAASGVSGTLTLKQVEGGVQVEGDLRGFAPSSKHGFHIHETGDCSAQDGMSAGGHYNPGHA